MITKRVVSLAASAAVLTLSACSNNADSEPFLRTAGRAISQAVTQRSSAPVPDAPRSPEEMAAAALAVNPGPLIMVTLEGQGTTQVMALVGENKDMRTYMTPNEQAVILRGGMLIGTRGLGHDLSTTESAPSATLIRAGRPGQVQRMIRYYAADGTERPLPFDCTVASGSRAGVIVESCEGNGISFQNNYLVSGGAITTSRQWGGPGQGYLTIQTLRP